jgi:hypothetical protein
MAYNANPRHMTTKTRLALPPPKNSEGQGTEPKDRVTLEDGDPGSRPQLQEPTDQRTASS